LSTLYILPEQLFKVNKLGWVLQDFNIVKGIKIINYHKSACGSILVYLKK